jgi:simple sugar transport system permease protein
VLAVLIGGVLTAVSGSNPWNAYVAIATGSLGPAGWASTLAIAVPVVACALAVSIPLRAGFVNLGGEGQIVGGGIAAIVVGTWFPGLPFPLSLVAALAAAALVGAVIGFIPAAMENTLGVPLLISSLLLSYPLVAIASFLVRFPLLDPSTGLPQTRPLPGAFQLPSFGAVSSGVIVIGAIVVATILFDRMTPSSFEARLTGLNRRFTAYSGVAVGRIALWSMGAGGAIAGIGGALVVMAFPFRFIDGALITPAYVWTGLLAAMLARANPIGSVVASFFFAALQIGGAEMERETFVPRELGSILQAAVIIILAGALAVRAVTTRKTT